MTVQSQKTMPRETFFNLPEDKHQRILDVLLDEFASNSYQEVSVDQIVERAGISKGSFYQYFEDKQDCYLYLIQMVMDEKLRFMSSFQVPEDEGDLFNTLRIMIEAGLDFQFSSPRLGRIGYRATMEDVPLPEQTRELIGQGSRAYFKNLVEDGVRAGTIRSDIDPATAAFLFDAVFSNLGEFILEHYQLESTDLLKNGASLFQRDDIRETIQQTLEVLEWGFRPTNLSEQSDHD